MANSYKGNPIVLDTFTGIIDLASQLGYASGTPFKVNSIEWQTPTGAGDTALITDAVNGNTVFSEKCTTANQSIIKYFSGAWISNFYIAANGVGSGKIVIMLA